MNREELKDKIKSVKDVSVDRQIIYSVLSELGIPFKKTNCRRCLTDLLNICKEELGIINNAAEESDFNVRSFYYNVSRPTSWNGMIVDWDSSNEVLSKFCVEHPDYCE